jgi:murein L,D-transpeptidase YafK
MRKALSLVLVSFILLLPISSCQVGSATLRFPVDSSMAHPINESVAQRRPLPRRLPEPRIIVRKSERKLFLYSAGKLVRTFKIGLGLSPLGDKVRAGDRRTPEGDFYIFTRNDKSAFYLSLGISYPNEVHAARGLRDGLINRTQYKAIMLALKAKKTPPQNTRLGGDIYIHGRGSSSDWTWGCVALEDTDIRELFEAVTVGTPVSIQP